MAWTARIVRTYVKPSAADARAAIGNAHRAVAQVIGGLSRGFVDVAFESGGKLEARAILDRKLRDGAILGADGRLLSWVRGGKLLPFGGQPVPRMALPALKKLESPAAPVATAPALVARSVRSIASRADLAALTKVERAQLTAAAVGLCGKRGLESLTKACDATGTGLEQILLSEGETPRFDGWLTASAEDGVFFDHGRTKPSGFTISQTSVADELSDRTALAAAIERAMKKLRLPRARPWMG